MKNTNNLEKRKRLRRLNPEYFREIERASCRRNASKRMASHLKKIDKIITLNLTEGKTEKREKQLQMHNSLFMFYRRLQLGGEPRPKGGYRHGVRKLTKGSIGELNDLIEKKVRKLKLKKVL